MTRKTRRALIHTATAALVIGALRPALAQPAAGEPERGSFDVPEDRNDPASRRITLRYLRFASKAARPGPPLVFLAGGPGGSGINTARGVMRPLFEALREAGDVIALDQRGVGASNAIPACPAASAAAVLLTREGLTQHYRAEMARCWAFWRGQGVAMAGYNTRQSAQDLDDLRRHLGAEQIGLWGASYGSHLALAALKYHAASIHSVALAGLEGLDQTVKRPARVDRALLRLSALVAADPAASAAFGDLPTLMRRVHARLDREPARVAGQSIDGFGIQMFAGQMVKAPEDMARLPLFYWLLDRGDYSVLGPILAMVAGSAQTLRGMPEAMDLASGVSPARLARVQAEARTALLGEALNFPMPQVLGAISGVDLGEGFRAPFRTRVPALLMAGTLDGRTPLEEQREVGAGFAASRWIIVENGGHNVLGAAPEIGRAMVAFFKGEPVASSTVRLPPPRFLLPDQAAGSSRQ